MKRIIAIVSIFVVGNCTAFAACDNGNAACTVVEHFSQSNSRPSDTRNDTNDTVVNGITVRTLSNGAQVRVSVDGKYGVDRYGRHVNLTPRP